MHVHVVALEGFDERFGHAVRLRAAHRCEARHKAKLDGNTSTATGKTWSKDKSYYGVPIGTVVTDEVTAP